MKKTGKTVSSNEDLLKYVREIKKGRNEYLEKVLKELENALKGMANKYQRPGIDRDDIFQIASIGIYDAIKAYDENKTKNISLFLRLCAENDIKDEVTRLSRDKAKTLSLASSLDAPVIVNSEKDTDIRLADIIEDDFSTESFVEKKIFHEIIREEINCKNISILECDILRLRMRDYSNKEISNKLDITGKQVDNAYQRAKKKMKLNTVLREIYDCMY